VFQGCVRLGGPSEVMVTECMGCGHLTALQEWPPAARPCLPCGMLGGSLVLIRLWGFLVSGIPVARSSVVDERSDSLLGSGGARKSCALFFLFMRYQVAQQRAAWENHPW